MRRIVLFFFLLGMIDVHAAQPLPEQFAMWIEQAPPTDALVVIGWEYWRLDGFSYGICIDPEEAVIEACGPVPVAFCEGAGGLASLCSPSCEYIVCPADMRTLLPDRPIPDFNMIYVFPEGIAQGVVFDLMQTSMMPARARLEVLRFHCTLKAPSASLAFCSGVLGAPPIENVMVADFSAITPARQDGLTLTMPPVRRVPSDYATIQEAVDAAHDREIVLLAPGEYVVSEPIDFNRLHVRDDPASPPVKNIALCGEGAPEQTIIRMSAAPADSARASVVVFENGESGLSRIENVTITGGAGSILDPAIPNERHGGGILCMTGTAPMIVNCRLVGNSATIGGAVAAHNAMLMIIRSTVSGNAGTAITYQGGTYVLLNCAITSNDGKGAWGGGVLCADASVEIENCTITGNTSGSGGGVMCAGARVKIENCTIAGNTSESGGGVAVRDGAAVAFRQCQIRGNVADVRGGGVACERSSVQMYSCTIAANTAGCAGGFGCFDCLESHDVVLNGCSIVGNRAGREGGGGILVRESYPRIVGCSIRGNGTDELGGGIKCSARAFAEIENCVIFANSARRGGGIGCDLAEASPAISMCTIVGNAGGGVACTPTAPVPLVRNSIVWYNAGGAGLPSFDARYSCIEGAEDAGGNNGEDPRFLGWGVAEEVHVDADNPDAGDGSQTNPYASVEAALDFGLALAPDSPCLTMSREGARIGADTGVCDAAGATARLVRVAPGSYALHGTVFACNVSLEGAGQDETVLRGALVGTRTGATFRALTVADGTEGGCIAAPSEAPYFEACTFRGHAGRPAIECDGASPTFVDCAIMGNYPTVAQTILCHGHAAPLFRGCLIAGNVQGVHVRDCSPRFERCTVTCNTASFTIEGSIGSTTLDACEIIGNAAGVECLGATARLVNCVVAGNDWHAVRVSAFGEMTLVNCTVAGNNVRVEGGGVACDDGTARLVNTILWKNGPGEDCGDFTACVRDRDPLFIDEGSFDFERSTTLTLGDDTANVPDFVVAMPDYRLRPDSPAINTGVSAGAPAYDLAGNVRPCGGGVDIGAYENCVAWFMRGDANADGLIDVADAIAAIYYLFGGLELPCIAAVDANDDNEIDSSDAIFLLYHLFVNGDAPAAPFGRCGIDTTGGTLACATYPPCLRVE